MKVRPVLGDWEIPKVTALRSRERRDLVELPVPGRVGSLFQDNSSAPMAILIEGALFGDDARETFVNEIRSRFQAGEPVTFVADIVTSTELQYVVLERLDFEEVADRPDEVAWSLVLRESPPPPPPPDPLGGLDTGLLDDAAGLLDSATAALDAIDALGNVPDFGNPVPQLTGSLDSLKGTTDKVGDAVSRLNTLFGIGS